MLQYDCKLHLQLHTLSNSNVINKLYIMEIHTFSSWTRIYIISNLSFYFCVFLIFSRAPRKRRSLSIYYKNASGWLDLYGLWLQVETEKQSPTAYSCSPFEDSSSLHTLWHILFQRDQSTETLSTKTWLAFICEWD